MSQDQDFSAGERHSTLLGAVGHGAPKSQPHLSLQPLVSSKVPGCAPPSQVPGRPPESPASWLGQPTPAEQNSTGLQLGGGWQVRRGVGRESGAGRRFKGVKVEMGSHTGPGKGRRCTWVGLTVAPLSCQHLTGLRAGTKVPRPHLLSPMCTARQPVHTTAGLECHLQDAEGNRAWTGSRMRLTPE